MNIFATALKVSFQTWISVFQISKFSAAAIIIDAWHTFQAMEN